MHDLPTHSRGNPAIRHALLIHGAGAGGWEWNLWREVLHARGFTTLAPDLQPAAGGLAATSLDDYRDQVRAALTGLPRPCVLIGASLGGLLAMRCADRADALVLINPLPPAPWAAQLPPREWPELVPWRRDARLASTRRAMPDADEAAALYALRCAAGATNPAGSCVRPVPASRRPRRPARCCASRPGATGMSLREPPHSLLTRSVRPCGSTRTAVTSVRCSAATPPASPRRPPTGCRRGKRRAPVRTRAGRIQPGLTAAARRSASRHPGVWSPR